MAQTKSFAGFAQDADLVEVKRHQKTLLAMAIDQHEMYLRTRASSFKEQQADQNSSAGLGEPERNTSNNTNNLDTGAEVEALATLGDAIKKAPNSDIVPLLMLYKGVFLLDVSVWESQLQKQRRQSASTDFSDLGSPLRRQQSTASGNQGDASHDLAPTAHVAGGTPADAPSPQRPAPSPANSSARPRASAMEDALAVADQAVLMYPGRCEGYYLRSMVYSELNKIQEAIRNFKVAQRIYADLEAEVPPVKIAMEKLAVKVKNMRHQRMRDANKNHAKTYNAYSNCKCLECGSTYDYPTPQWLCTKCYTTTSKEVMIWEPDEEKSSCSLCSSSLGFGGRHHCRCCGKLVCGKCSKDKMPVPTLSFPNSVRVCSACHSTQTLEGLTVSMATGSAAPGSTNRSPNTKSSNNSRSAGLNPYHEDALTMEDP